MLARRTGFSTAALAALVLLPTLPGCGGPLSGLSSEDKRFLFADSASDAAFMGKPHDGALPSCDPDRMDQAFVLVDTQRSIWLDSVRPTGVERHAVRSVTKVDSGFEVLAVNGADIPFRLTIVRSGNAIAEISWDGSEPSTFLRCEKATRGS